MSFLRILSSRLAPSPILSYLASAGPLHRLLTTSAASKAALRTKDSIWNPVDSATKQVSEKITQVASKGAEKTPANLWEEQSENVKLQLADIGRITNDPYIGRSAKVVDGDLADAFKRLDMILARNKVRKQLKLAERHEKKGPKRRRLESERWRRLFAHEVRKNVQLVTKIRRRGA
ncbi:hypothetical protein F5890DRAFT_811007 [Lentinula detonsa]|uniref:Uncharacterized protein n=2 Tax=Lentinula detonsa TaxID=2804962 RepID=A0AA38Q5F9_9AGAR|nr:hypothetical protein F5890DRAFT_811007 [Lentinula detonsa]